jgi:hypothetical protein
LSSQAIARVIAITSISQSPNPLPNYPITRLPNPHVDLVGLLFVLWGLLTTLIGLSTLALGIGAVALITSGAVDSGGQFAAGLTAAAFTTLALIAILWGAAHIAVGLPLRRRRPWSRVLALTLGSVDLVLLPYGTALGCYTLWTLLREEGKRSFEMSD